MHLKTHMLHKLQSGFELLVSSDDDRALLLARQDGETLFELSLTRQEGKELASKLFEHEDWLVTKESAGG